MGKVVIKGEATRKAMEADGWYYVSESAARTWMRNTLATPQGQRCYVEGSEVNRTGLGEDCFNELTANDPDAELAGEHPMWDWAHLEAERFEIAEGEAQARDDDY